MSRCTLPVAGQLARGHELFWRCVDTVATAIWISSSHRTDQSSGSW